MAAATAADQAAMPVLHLTNGGFVSGEVLASDDPNVLPWRSPYFALPCKYPLGAVNAVHFPVPGPLPQPSGDYCFELVDDDVLYGKLLRLTEDEVELESERVGRVRLRRAHLRRLYRSKGADAVYFGPNGRAGWKERSATSQWAEEGGHLFTDQAWASLYGNLGVPEQALIEFKLSWKRQPDFFFALGVDERDVSLQQAFHFEVWDGELVVFGESARDADVASVQRVASGAGHVHLQAYLDQRQGRLILLSPSGNPLATLNIKVTKPQPQPGVRLTNRKGDIRLEQLRIARWNGLPPREVREDQARVHRTDGSIVYGRLAAYDPDAKQFTIRDGMMETLVGQDALADVFLSPSPAAGKAANPVAATTPQRTMRMAYRDGARFSGTLTRIEQTHVTLTCPGVKGPLRLPLAELRSLIALRPGQGSTAPPVTGKPGRLELEGVNLRGRIVDGSGQPDAGYLMWHPDLALNASPLLHGLSGRIVYREPPPPPRPIVATARPAVILGGVMRRAVPITPQRVTPPVPPADGRRSMHLRCGDTIPCEVIGIDEKGVSFKTPLSDATFIAHERIKSVELIPTRDAPRLDDPKRDRLLTLPRLHKASPPTHLLCSKNGDFLRGRVLEMDDTRLTVEVRLETRVIPRDRIAQIIWLHADELSGEKTASPPVDASRANRVQAVRAHGNRLTFVAEKSDHKSISGRSDVLGACRIDLADVDELLFGTYIEQSAAKLAYHTWKLHHAIEPKFAQADPDASTDGRATGLESPLVGQPAFAFRLDMLDGSLFNLAEHQGRVVVLDFWATWCGPCMQSMPLIDAVVREFADRGVELVAVNLEEQAGEVKATLERHKLKLAVALDRDAVIAAKYAVTAIPQTVVIDRDGKVARLYVGGGKEMADSLRKALQELTTGKSSR